jgi:hypothetical protein
MLLVGGEAAEREIDGGGGALGFGSGRRRKAWGLGFPGKRRGARGWRGLNRPREALACGPMAKSITRRREPELGSGSGSVRPKVGDDMWPPLVGDRGRGAQAAAALGHYWAGVGVLGPSWADGSQR